jgi:hypothetical protein
MKIAENHYQIEELSFSFRRGNSQALAIDMPSIDRRLRKRI